jgi:hypothetical protein
MKLLDTITATMTQGGDESSFRDTATAVKDARILSIKTRNFGKSKNGKAIIQSNNILASLFLELQNKNGVTIVNAPLSHIFNASTNGDCKGLFVNEVIDWNNSKIRSYNSSILVTGEVVELLVEAEK